MHFLSRLARRLYKSRLFCFLAFCIFLVLFAVSALAQESIDITNLCQISMPGTKKAREKMLDGNYNTYWSRYDHRKYELVITLPEGVSEGGLYLRFFAEPAQLAVLNEDGEIHREEGSGFAHRYIPFQAQGQVTVQIWGTKKGFSLSEISVFSGTQPPSWVQTWQPSPKKADLMIIVAHPDDEFLWTGGAIPYYSLEQNKVVSVVYMTCANGLRRSEMLNALWLSGVRHYPVIGTFRDRTAPGLSGSLQIWGGEKKVESFIAVQYRRFKPEVVVTHDQKGEYGHLAHIITSRAAVSALTSANDSRKFPESAASFGTWDVPKMYIHLLKDQAITLEWDQPISSKGGISAMEVGILAFQEYRSQQRNYSLTPDGPHSPKRFGLYRSLVGEDVLKNDFFENINGEAKP